MRIVLDLQACQASSMNRGIGRYSLALALAITRHGGQHDVRVVVNGAFPDSAATLRTAFRDLLPSAALSSFAIPVPAAEGEPRHRWRLHAAERIREHYLASLRPDLVHVSSLFEGLGDNSVNSLLHGDGHFDTAMTLYDLIPLLRKERYLADPNMASWYYRKLESMKRAELLVAISASARDEAITALGLPPDRVVNISSAADDIFAPRALAPQARADLLARHGLHRPFVMYTGGIDYRKNIEGLIEAYAALPGDVRCKHQLAVICQVRESDRVRLKRLAAQCGLAQDELVLTGYVSDDDLVSLYNCTALFVFPSLHEGFGLPVLEAMSCGAPVIGANTSSIPEVIGRADAMFDPASVPAMTAAMAHVLADAAFADGLRAHGLAQARLFSWDASAKRALAAFEEVHRRRVAGRDASAVVEVALATRRPRMAFVSPLPPARSGIADYSAGLLPELARFYEIDLVLEQPELDAPWNDGPFALRTSAWFDVHAHEYDRIVYQFGNSAFHTYMFALLERHPGVVVLHDFFLSELLSHIESTSPLPNLYCRALYLSHGYLPLVEERDQGRATSCRTYPCNRAVLERAAGVIVHSRHALALAQHWYGTEAARDWHVVPLLRQLPGTSDRAAERAALGLAADDFLLCSFGMLTPNKCIDAIVQAWTDSAAGQDPHSFLVFVGAPVNDAFDAALRAQIADHPRIRITGYATEAVYRSHLAAADAAVQLRRASRGETSAAVLDCLAYGLPSIVNVHGSAAEIPDQACMPIDDDFSVETVAVAIDALRTDPALRVRLAAAARTCMEAHSPPRAGAAMHATIEALARSGDGAAQQRLLRSLATVEGTVTQNDQIQAAAAIAANRLPRGARQVLVDVTALAQSSVADDAAQERRGLVAALIAATPAGWRVEPVRHNGKQYRYARRFTLDLLGRADLMIEDAVTDTAPGDILFLFDGVTPPPCATHMETGGMRIADFPESTHAISEILLSLH